MAIIYSYPTATPKVSDLLVISNGSKKTKSASISSIIDLINTGLLPGVGTVTSIGVSAPSAFTVTNSPITSTGTIIITGAGTAGQYIDGTGALQSSANQALDTTSSVTFSTITGNGAAITNIDKYTTAQVDGFLALKANQATTYTTTQVDGFLALKANQATTYTKTEADALFSSGFVSAITPSSPAPTQNGLYSCSAPGTYTNFGGQVVSLTNQVVSIAVGGTQNTFTQVVSAVGNTVAATLDAIQNSTALFSGRAIYRNIRYKANLLVGTNLFNINDSEIAIGSFVNSNGDLSPNATYNTTGYIPISPSTQHVMSYRHGIAYYDENKTFISFSASGGPNPTTSPAGAYYIRCTVLASTEWSEFQLQLGAVETPFEPYSLKVDPNELDLTELATKEDYVKASRTSNLIDPRELIDGSFLSSTGVINSNSSYKLTGFIPFKQADVNIVSSLFTVSGGAYSAFYDENKVFISSFQNSLATWASNVAYVRFSGNNAGPVFYANVGTVLTTDLYNELKDLVNNESIVDNSISTAKIQDNAVTSAKIINEAVSPTKTNFFEIGTNKFNINDSDIAIDYYVSYAYGNLVSNTSYNATGFIPILGDTQYIASYNHQRAWYDENKVYISGINSGVSGVMTSPTNAKFIRCTVSKAEWDYFQLNEGNTLLPYASYGLFIKPEYISGSEDSFFPRLALPRKMHVLLNNENSVYHKNYIERWNPYQFAIDGSGTNWAYFERYFRLNNASAGNLTIKASNAVTLIEQSTNTLTTVSGDPATDNGTKILNVIGDSFTYNGAWYLKTDSLCPNLSFVGIRKSYSTPGASSIKAEGRGGWTVSKYMTDLTGSATDSHSPFLQPVDPYKYYGNTLFWEAVEAGTTGYGINGFTDTATAIGFDSNGFKSNPQANDVMYNGTSSIYQKYNGTSWETITEATLGFTFNYTKYLSTWNVSMPDYVPILLGTNDFRSSMPTDAFLASWKANFDTIFQSILAAGVANGKTVRVAMCTPTTQNESANNSTSVNPIFHTANVWKARNYIFETFDTDIYLNQGLDVVDTGSSLDGDFGFTMSEIKPFEDYTGTDRELYSSNTPHPSTEGYGQLGVRLAGYIQATR
tara:strand:+ start:4902 stop:8201 length:3300 start_codon:yes stop_codon:yes gene_type:complete